MAKPINLNQHRKSKARAEKRAQADANAVKFGRSKAEKQRDRLEAERTSARLDGGKIDRDPSV